MKQFIFSILFFFCIHSSLFAQTTIYPKGCYMSFEELKNLSPSENYDLTIRKLDSIEVKKYCCNDYRAFANSKKVKNRTIKKKIYAISDGEHAYINGYKIGHQKGYARIESEGRFIVFIAAISDQTMYNKNWLLNNIVYSQVLEGSIGVDVLIPGHRILPLLKFRGRTARFLYVLDSNQNEIYKLNSTIVKILLRDHKEELLSAYSEESDMRNIYVMISYMDELNKK